MKFLPTRGSTFLRSGVDDIIDKIGVALKSKDECKRSESRTASASPTQQAQIKVVCGDKTVKRYYHVRVL